MSGCVEAIYVLPIMMGKDDGHNIVDLCRERNEHDDTPIMIACVYNQVDFLRQLQTELQEKDFLELLQARNKSEETPMSLALGHGHASIVNFLLGAGVEANYDLVQECKVKMRHMETMLAQASIHPPEYREQQTNVKRCLVTLEVALAKNARDAMEQLIQSETAEKSRLGTEASHFKTPPAVPKRLPAEGSDIAPNTETRNFENSPWKKAESDLGAAVSISKPLYQTLLDGSVVSSAESESTIVGPSTATSQDTLAKSPNDLLRSRLGNDAAAVMESLCLDASMLLETPHKMAMHMSPSQLQAIENVLNQQLEAVQQAKDIQQRLRSSS
jgi:ankyrin repeat protein